ncbi:hypothetical protein RV12_GL000111 [Enterococcus quebecensis]|nr:hypothetical protein RV12_GL000111 [Enterococcus quebecensis]
MAVLFILVACGLSTNSVGHGHGREDSKKSADAATAKVGDFTVTIYNDYEVMKLYDEMEIIVITYDFTNNSDENQTFNTAIYDKAFQGGIRIERSYLAGIFNRKKFKGSRVEILPGTTITLQKAYKLRDSTSPVTIEIENYDYDHKEKLTKEFNLQK